MTESKTPPDQEPQDQAKELEQQCEDALREDSTGKIRAWLDLAKKAFDKDDDPTPNAA